MIEYMKAEEAVNPLEDLPFVAYFSMSKYLESQIPTQLRPPAYERKDRRRESLTNLAINVMVGSLCMAIGLYLGAYVLV